MTKLASLSGATTRNIIRNPDHADDVRDRGGIPVVADIETCSVAELAEAYGDADVVVFAAGAGSHRQRHQALRANFFPRRGLHHPGRNRRSVHRILGFQAGSR
ncbi:NAD(P)H-binding protein [Corynebacterium sp. CCM 8862]|uniref:NAD(P)H-binding protein n=1 Tax=Corynebacterium mendelii TaxID=2765362 RepID=A0A939IZ18_9CORY|nr:NAD(P)H-binding protein [Corynebacterium mendelii]